VCQIGDDTNEYLDPIVAVDNGVPDLLLVAPGGTFFSEYSRPCTVEAFQEAEMLLR